MSKAASRSASALTRTGATPMIFLLLVLFSVMAYAFDLGPFAYQATAAEIPATERYTQMKQSYDSYVHIHASIARNEACVEQWRSSTTTEGYSMFRLCTLALGEGVRDYNAIARQYNATGLDCPFKEVANVPASIPLERRIALPCELSLHY